MNTQSDAVYDRKLSCGAQEIVDRFKAQYSMLSESERDTPEREISLTGRYAYKAAASAFWALGPSYGYPRLVWSMKGVTFVLRSGIPSTVGVYDPPDEVWLLKQSIFEWGLTLLMPLALCIGVLLCYKISAATTTFLAILACVGTPMLSTLLLAELISTVGSALIAKTMFKH